MSLRLHSLARQLGGYVCGNTIRMPGPGHSPKDDSLVVWVDGDEIRVHSHSGKDDWRTCRDYVRQLLGLPHKTVNSTAVGYSKRPEPPKDSGARTAWALRLWQEAQS